MGDRRIGWLLLPCVAAADENLHRASPIAARVRFVITG